MQILEAARLKRTNDYLDPVTGFSQTMKVLTSNNELIIIPKMHPRHKALNSNFSSMNSLINYNNYDGNSKNSNNCSISGRSRSCRNKKISNTDKELTSAMISEIIENCQKSIASNNKIMNEKMSYFQPKQIKLSDHWNGATVEIKQVPNPHYNQFLDLSKVTQNKAKSTNKSPSLRNFDYDPLDQQPVLTSLGNKIICTFYILK